ncbi:hypothetical protein NKH75_29765, partial [Mesorhizobium sp. M0984]|uniref:hypothetical protein n=1 Tax=Mesorhizobium sp. M0984 TaxID=2957041 RepID=UPI00333AF618
NRFLFISPSFNQGPDSNLRWRKFSVAGHRPVSFLLICRNPGYYLKNPAIALPGVTVFGDLHLCNGISGMSLRAFWCNYVQSLEDLRDVTILPHSDACDAFG